MRISVLAAFILAAAPISQGAEQTGPNIVVILADDLGYGDVGCFNPEGKIATPNLDRLAKEGRKFTDAHTGSAVCTPTRYGLLTGRYAWRTRLTSGVLGGYSPPLIEPGRATVASLLKSKGYQTGCFGKWHLGWHWARAQGAEFGDEVLGGKDEKADRKLWSVEWTKPISNGPLAVGFNRFFGISASLDMPPFVFIDDNRVAEVPSVEKFWLRRGPAGKSFEAIDVLPRVTDAATRWIEARANAKDGPFFVYLPLASPHTPIVPTADWQHKSGLNAYADFVMQTDAAIGAVLAVLERHGFDRDTLVIVTSDNGCSPQANFDELRKHGHDPSAGFRGHKADIYEGGHRVPFIARWPDRVPSDSTCSDTICLTDLLATCAAIAGAELPKDAGEDSVNLLPDLTGTATGPLREATVHHSINGSFAIRQGPWKLALCPGSGGWSHPRPGAESKPSPAVQLFNLDEDRAEITNLEAEHPEIVQRLTALLDSYKSAGRSVNR